MDFFYYYLMPKAQESSTNKLSDYIIIACVSIKLSWFKSSLPLLEFEV